MSGFRSRRVIVFALIIIFTLVPVWIMAESMFSGGPLDGRTGAPGEGLCTDCHGGGTPDDGSVEISGIPSYYVPGQTYSITVTLQDQGQLRWGFELTAIDDLGAGAGAFTVTDGINTQLSDNADPDRDYMKHTSTGTYAGTPNGPVTWQFDWTAPVASVGNITFYAAGNAANNNGANSGDNIYTTSKLLTDVPTPPIPATTPAGMIVLTALLVLTAFFLLTRRRRTIG